MSRTPLYFEDLVIGQVFRSTTSITLTAAEIVAFAEQFDPQPFHTDAAAAEHSFFRGLAASGWHTVGVTMRLLVIEGPPIAGGLIGASMDEVRWPRPTRPGDALRIEATFTELRRSERRPEYARATMRTTTFNQRDEVAQILVSNMVVPIRGGGTAT